ncbi:MAG TPA: TrbG/VirB9 family P-type conjugative transfer protein [Candidatus Omnitrophota bacterium]|nr:TrbG/VirB9 family P-type conjugative transfer protein [Candidatus Omnitrophota bacterium]
MNSLKILWRLSIVVLAITVGFSVLARADDSVQPETVLKDRQHFNKLKRSTRNIYKVTMRSGVVFKLQTALGYVSTIDLPEKALKVFIGDQELFKVGVYEKQVLIKPITDEVDARSNLVIVTDSGRLAFDVSVGAPETADFVVDFRLPEEDEALVQNAFEKKVKEKSNELERKFKSKEEKLNEKAEKISEEKLTAKIASGITIIPLKASAAKDKVQVNLLSLSRSQDKGYLRFSILNYSPMPYRVSKVVLGAVTEERKVLKKEKSGIAEFQSELSLPRVINPDSYEYGVLVFDYRVLGKNENPVFKIIEDAGLEKTPRDFEITGFKWLEHTK